MRINPHNNLSILQNALIRAKRADVNKNKPHLYKILFNIALKYYSEAFVYETIGWQRCLDCDRYSGECRCEYFDEDDFANAEDLVNQILKDIFKVAKKADLMLLYNNLATLDEDLLEEELKRIEKRYKYLLKRKEKFSEYD